MSNVQTVFKTERLRAAAASALEAIDQEVRAVEPIQTGNRKTTAIARFPAHQPVVVQVCAEQRWLQTEAALLAQIRDRTTVPVPPVLVSGSVAGVAYMLTPLVSGDSLHERFTRLTPASRAELAYSFGASLAELHDAFRFDGYGTLAVTDGTLRADGEWASWFEQYTRDALDRLPAAFDPEKERIERLLADGPGEQAPTARLFPWDFRPGNALYAEGELTGILDWEAPLAAPASLSVGKAEYLVADWYVDEPAPLREAFRRGYESQRAYPEIPPSHRAVAIIDTAVDSTGTVTNPGYPEADRDAAIAFHRAALDRIGE